MIFLLLFHGEMKIVTFKVFEMKYSREVKTMIKNGVKEDDLVQFKFHQSIYKLNTENFKWMKKNEFMLDGNMYDIVRTEFKNDSVTFYCIHDFKESKLFANYHLYFSNFIKNNKEKKDELFTMLQSFSQFYTSANNDIKKSLFEKEEEYTTIITSHLSAGELRIITPPPNC